MRFAKDLHDGLGPLLSAIKLSVSALLLKERSKDEKEILLNADEIVNEAIKSIKEISNNLSPYVLTHFGLATAIKNFTDKINENKSLEIDFQSNIFQKRFDNNIEVVLYRAICELVNNTIKHANATLIKIRLEQIENKLIINYDDDGIGFNPSLINDENDMGMGLQNIFSRVRSINGEICVENKSTKGMLFIISIII
jgi:signal transduction histidine kinase